MLLRCRRVDSTIPDHHVQGAERYYEFIKRDIISKIPPPPPPPPLRMDLITASEERRLREENDNLRSQVLEAHENLTVCRQEILALKQETVRLEKENNELKLIPAPPPPPPTPPAQTHAEAATNTTRHTNTPGKSAPVSIPLRASSTKPENKVKGKAAYPPPPQPPPQRA
ncbi:hypothetical protein BGX38DRAFT_1278205 [Terfezia claveryi]|nr:hypothetical protein BGX38DRAFT_1278205 [Terfezia claveryi]